MDRVSPSTRSRNMQAIRSKDMKPEMIIRRLVHGMGYRYRLHRHDLPGRPDMVFPGARKIIFIHGCFWHRHDDPSCKLAHAPRSNLDYWKPKLARTVARDALHREALEAEGWQLLVLWECQVTAGKVGSQAIRDFLDGAAYSS